MSDLVSKRGDIYGHPRDNFRRIAHLVVILQECPEDIARHILYSILVKVSRLIESPTHKDSWDDIIGYVETAYMALDMKDDRTE